MPFQTRRWDKDLCIAVGVAGLERDNVKSVVRDLAAGRFGTWPAAVMPYSSAIYYVNQEKTRRAKTAAQKAAANPSESVTTKVDRMSHQLLDMCQEQLNAYTVAKTFDPAEAVKIVTVMQKIRGIARNEKDPDDPDTQGTPADPLTTALLANGARPKTPSKPKRTKDNDKATKQEPQPTPEPTNTTTDTHSAVAASEHGNGFGQGPVVAVDTNWLSELEDQAV